MKFGDKLKEIRKIKGLSQKELGDILDLGQTTIANYEKNIRFPSPEILVRIANIFDETIDQLLGRIEGKELSPFDEDELSIIKETTYRFLMDEDEKETIDYITSLEINSQERVIQLYENVFQVILEEIGNQWQLGTITVAKEHYISGIIHTLIIKILSNNEVSFEIELKEKGNVICLSLSSEPHTLGIRMISEYFKMLGYKSYYLGSNVPTDALIDLIIRTKPKFIAISVTMDYHIDGLTNLISVIKASQEIDVDILKELEIVVGGQGVSNEEQALLIGADIYANDYESLKNAVSNKQLSS